MTDTLQQHTEKLLEQTAMKAGARMAELRFCRDKAAQAIKEIESDNSKPFILYLLSKIVDRVNEVDAEDTKALERTLQAAKDLLAATHE